jgi:hypothetical protein
MCSCTLFLSLEFWNGIEVIIFTFERSIRAEVVTYRLDNISWSLHMHQLHGFDELRNEQGIIRNRSPNIDTAVVLLSSSASD